MTGLPLVSVTDAVKVVVLDPLASMEEAPVTYTSTSVAAPAVKVTDFWVEVMALAVAV